MAEFKLHKQLWVLSKGFLNTDRALFATAAGPVCASALRFRQAAAIRCLQEVLSERRTSKPIGPFAVFVSR